MPDNYPTNRSAITLPTDLAQEILQKAQGSSAIMQLAQKVTLPGRGLTIPVITGDPEAAWVEETGAKPVSAPGIFHKVLAPYTLAVIVPFSNQFRRDLKLLYDNIVARLPGALALKFDQTVMGAVNKPGTNFDNFANCTAQSLVPSQNATAYDGLVAADADIAAQGGLLSAFALSPAGRSLLLSAKDTTGRPIFLNSVAEGAPDRLLGVPAVFGRGVYKAGVAPVGTGAGTPAIVGVAGDWTQAMYGIVDTFDISISDQATLTYVDENSQTVTLNLWQRNMFAVRAEFEVGFVANTGCFDLLTGATPQS